MPYANPTTTAQALDYRRLGKQRVETLQILNTLTGRSTGWQNHPAVKMWRGYEIYLSEYGIAMCNEWVKRGYKDTCTQKIVEIRKELILGRAHVKIRPYWIEDERIHKSHQSNLVRKDPAYYLPIFGNIDPTLEYYWPEGIEENQQLSWRDWRVVNNGTMLHTVHQGVDYQLPATKENLDRYINLIKG